MDWPVLWMLQWTRTKISVRHNSSSTKTAHYMFHSSIRAMIDQVDDSNDITNCCIACRILNNFFKFSQICLSNFKNYFFLELFFFIIKFQLEKSEILKGSFLSDFELNFEFNTNGRTVTSVQKRIALIPQPDFHWKHQETCFVPRLISWIWEKWY